jgi:NTE family protein
MHIVSNPAERPGQPYVERLLEQLIAQSFGALEPATLAFLRAHLQWIELPGGAPLMTQGEPADHAFMLVSGRLRVYIRDAQGGSRMVRELARGEVIGEMAMYTGEPRTATVVAVRDSVLVRLDRAHFAALLATSPATSIVFTRQIIRRLQTESQQRRLAAPVTIGLLAISDGVAPAPFARALAAQLERHGKVRLLDAAAIAAVLGVPGVAARDDADSARRMALAIDAEEAHHDFVLLLADAGDTPWTRCCVRHADELLLVADAGQPPRLHPLEAPLAARAAPAEAAEVLVLLQPLAQPAARDTRAWLARRPVSGHLHVRRDHAGDLARLARLLARKAVGLVFGGGGARGFAHLGVWRALRARGLDVDCVGGTSIGAVMAALVALDPSCERAIEVARRAFGENPTGDLNLLPLVSLIKGDRAREAIERSIAELAGTAVDIEDLWKPFFCVATNYSQAREQVLDRGDLGRALRASIAIPGALPPVVRDGDLLCDGGTFNNFPVNLMRQQRGVGPVLGVDLGGRSPRRLAFDEMPSSWALLRDRLRPRSARRYRLPSLASYLVNVTIMYSVSRQQEARAATDLYFNPPLYKVGLLQWKRFDEVLRQGERHANEVLDALTAEQRAALGLPG